MNTQPHLMKTQDLVERVTAFLDYATQYAGGVSLGSARRPDQNLSYGDLRDLLAHVSRLEAEKAGLREERRLVVSRIPMDYLRKHDAPGATGPTDALDLPAAMKDYAEARWRILDQVVAADERAQAAETQAAHYRKALEPFNLDMSEYDDVSDGATVHMLIMGGEELGDIEFKAFRDVNSALSLTEQGGEGR